MHSSSLASSSPEVTPQKIFSRIARPTKMKRQSTFCKKSYTHDDMDAHPSASSHLTGASGTLSKQIECTSPREQQPQRLWQQRPNRSHDKKSARPQRHTPWWCSRRTGAPHDGCDHPAAAGFSGSFPAKASRTLAFRSFLVKGFWINNTPSSSTPRWAITLAVYPDMKRMLKSG
jgi:hypothetical protein